MRHNKLLSTELTTFDYQEEIIDPYIQALVISLDMIDSIPVGSVNSSLSTSNGIINNSSIEFSNGFINLGNLNLSREFTIEFWFRSTGNQPLISFQNQLSVEYNNQTFRVNRRISNYFIDTIQEDFTLDSNWHHLICVRNYNEFYLFIDTQEILKLEDFYYDIDNSNLYLGANLNANSYFTGNLTLLNIYNKAIYPSIVTASSNTECFRAIRQSVNDRNSFSLAKIFDLTVNESVSNTQIQVSNALQTYFDSTDQHWVISPDTFTLKSDLVKTVKPLTLDLVFKLEIEESSNVMVLSYWKIYANNYFYVVYEHSSNLLKFNYRQVNNTQSITIGQYIPNNYNYFTLQFLSNTLSVYLNGVERVNQTINLDLFHNFDFDFNRNIEGNTNINNKVLLKKLSIYEVRKYTNDYYPYLDNKKLFINSDILPTKSHVINKYYTYFPLLTSFDLSTNSNFISIDSNLVITINQSQRINNPTTYRVNLKLPKITDITSNLFTFPATVTIPANQNNIQITVDLLTYPINKGINRFTVQISNDFFSEEVDIEIQDARTLGLSTLTNISGYIDGYLTALSPTSGNIPNLLATRQATTASPNFESLYGRAINILSSNDTVNLPVTLTNIRTVVMLYREYSMVPTRSYVGDTAEYSFNGGANGELVGDLVLASSTYLRALNLSHRASNIKISSNNNAAIVLDDQTMRVLVYERNSSGIWSNIPTQLNLGLTESNVLSGASLAINNAGNCIAIGLKEASNGEGRVQIWRKVNSVWTIDLNMGSPIPSPSLGGFGYSIDINDLGNILVASELGSNSVYIFRKVNDIWNSTPVETIVGTDRFGFSISSNSDCSKIAISSADNTTTYVFNFSTTATLEQSITGFYLTRLSKTSNHLLLSNPLTRAVSLFSLTGTIWTAIRAITQSSIANWGYSIALNQDLDFIVGSPNESRVYQYRQADSWATPTLWTLTGNYGYVVDMNNQSLISSNYLDQVELITRDGSSIPQKVISVRQNKASVPLTTSLDSSDLQILSFSLGVPIQVSRIGSSLANSSLNGVFLGALFFNRVLSNSELEAIENFIIRYLSLERYSLV